MAKESSAIVRFIADTEADPFHEWPTLAPTEGHSTSRMRWWSRRTLIVVGMMAVCVALGFGIANIVSRYSTTGSPAAIGRLGAVAPIAPALLDAGVPAFREVHVTFASDPAGAKLILFADGQPLSIASTPVEAYLDTNRDYVVQFVAPDGSTVRRAVVFDDRERIVMHVWLGDSPVKRHDAPLRVATTPVGVVDNSERNSHVAEQPVRPPGVLSRVTPLESVAQRRDPPVVPNVVPKQASRSKRRTSDRPRIRGRRGQAERYRDRGATAAPRGTLVVNSKPPCRIYINGRYTGKTTPQRAIKLRPGVHRVTLVNRSLRIRKSVRVRIKSGRRTRVTRDLTTPVRR